MSRLKVAQSRKDVQIRKTQLALRSALLELVVERGYEKLSVQQILDRAGVGRATFYAHYRDKEDLLSRSLDQLRDNLVSGWKAASDGKSLSDTPLGFSLPFFQHVDGHRKLYRAVVGRESGRIVDRQMRRLLADLVRMEVAPADRRTGGNTRADLAAQYVVGALMSVVSWWLDRNVKLSAEQVDATFRQMTLPALQALRDSTLQTRRY